MGYYKYEDEKALEMFRHKCGQRIGQLTEKMFHDYNPGDLNYNTLVSIEQEIKDIFKELKENDFLDPYLPNSKDPNNAKAICGYVESVFKTFEEYYPTKFLKILNANLENTVGELKFGFFKINHDSVERLNGIIDSYRQMGGVYIHKLKNRSFFKNNYERICYNFLHAFLYIQILKASAKKRKDHE